MVIVKRGHVGTHAQRCDVVVLLLQSQPLRKLALVMGCTAVFLTGTACSSPASHPALRVASAPPGGSTQASSSVMYARAKLDVPNAQMDRFLRALNAEPAASGLYYRNAQRLLGVPISPAATATQIRDL